MPRQRAQPESAAAQGQPLENEATTRAEVFLFMAESVQSASQAPASASWLARVHVTLKPVVLDPQGSAVLGGLHTLGFTTVSSVRVGKYLEITLSAPDQASAQDAVQQMCAKLLANPVIEQFRFDLERLPG